jgi:hypothetical protein
MVDYIFQNGSIWIWWLKKRGGSYHSPTKAKINRVFQKCQLPIITHPSSRFPLRIKDYKKNDKFAKHINLPQIFLLLVIKLKVEAKFSDPDSTSLYILPYNRIRFAEELI